VPSSALRKLLGAAYLLWSHRSALALVSCAMLACAPIPKGRYTLDTLDMSGARHVDDEDIQR
jgi:hypothetical protein